MIVTWSLLSFLKQAILDLSSELLAMSDLMPLVSGILFFSLGGGMVPWTILIVYGIQLHLHIDVLGLFALAFFVIWHWLWLSQSLWHFSYFSPRWYSRLRFAASPLPVHSHCLTDAPRSESCEICIHCAIQNDPKAFRKG